MPDTLKDNENSFMDKAVEVAIRLGLLALMLFWCYSIIKPFVEISLWSIIFAVALYPVFKWFNKKLHNKKKLSAILIVLLMILIFLIPAIFFANSLYDGILFLKNNLDDPEHFLPKASPAVLNWPLIGKIVYEKWNWLSENINIATQEYLPQIKEFGLSIISAFASVGVAYLKFLISLIISGVILVYSESGGKFAQNFFTRIIGDKGVEYADIAEKTIRNVVKGILGVAFIQSILMGIGFSVAGVPATGLWVMLALILGIIQIGIFPVIVPVLIYEFSTADTFTSVALLIWCIILAPLDNILKPILLGRGASVPMLIIFLGAIGGFIYSGIIGLFTGAIIFSIGYKIFISWLNEFQTDIKLP